MNGAAQLVTALERANPRLQKAATGYKVRNTNRSSLGFRKETWLANIPFRVSPMLATLVDEPFDRPNWIFEEKYDGVRMLAYKESSRVSLISRNAIDRTDRYPEIARAIQQLKPDTVALDGEVVVFDARKVSRFQLLQQGKGDPQFVIFDCLYLGGKDLRRQPLSSRREILENLSNISGVLQISAKVATNGLKAFRISSQRGFEGIVSKNLKSIYESRRSREWLKVKGHHEQEFVIAGFTKPEGSRTNFRALLLGVYAEKGSTSPEKWAPALTMTPYRACARSSSRSSSRNLPSRVTRESAT
jgi:bifunctional non-homologous end joining protein LigD